MSTKDITKNISKNIIFGILAGVIATMGLTGISNISAQGMSATTPSPVTNDTSQTPGKSNLTGTIDVDKAIADAFKSKVTVNIIDAITTAQNSVGPNSTVKEVELTEAHGYLVYKMKIIGEDMKKYKVIVDPGNGEVLLKKEIICYDEHNMKYSAENGDKYSHEYKMTIEDKKY
jgi:hypothetical protein